MGHFAKVENNIVTRVIVADQAWIDTGIEGDPNDWIQVSYNTRGGVHYGQDGKPDGGTALRGNYPGIGYVYDKTHDVFYHTQPYPSWVLDHTTWTWNAPIPWPGEDYDWNETTKTWDKNR